MNTAIERRGFTPPSSARAEQITRAREFKRGLQAQEYFDTLPQRLLLAQSSPDLTNNLFISEAVRSIPVKQALLGIETGAIAMAIACSSGQAKEINITPPQQVEARPTATARPGGGGLIFEDPRLNELFDKIARGQASEEEIIEYNQGAAASEAKANATATAKSDLATAEAQKPTTPTVEPTTEPKAEIENEVECKIIDPEYCKEAELLEWTAPNGVKGKFVGLRISEGNLYSPNKSQISKAQFPEAASFKGFQASIVNFNSGYTIYIRGDIDFPNMLTVNVNEGESFAKIDNTDISNFGYDILVNVGRQNPNTGKAESADDILEKLFPEAFKKPAKLVTEKGPDNPVKTSSPIFIPKPK